MKLTIKSISVIARLKNIYTSVKLIQKNGLNKHNGANYCKTREIQSVWNLVQWFI